MEQKILKINLQIYLNTLYHCHWLSGGLPLLLKPGHQLLVRNIFHGILCTLNKLLLQNLPCVPHSSLRHRVSCTFFDLWLWNICLIYNFSSNLWAQCSCINNLQQIRAEMCILKIYSEGHLLWKLKFVFKIWAYIHFLPPLFFFTRNQIKRSLWVLHNEHHRRGKIVVSFGISNLKVVEKYASAFPVEREIIW